MTHKTIQTLKENEKALRTEKNTLNKKLAMFKKHNVDLQERNEDLIRKNGKLMVQLEQEKRAHDLTTQNFTLLSAHSMQDILGDLHKYRNFYVEHVDNF